MKTNIKPTIGLEVHVELATKSKMFCGCSADNFGKDPNTQTCPVCLGLPGALPVPNEKAIDWVIMIGLALNCKINLDSKFDRKHYFYADLPKGYQISQYDKPFCVNGYLDTSEGKVKITRVHLEEDTGKLVHRKIKGKVASLVDFNRSGVPLVEVVTEPDIHSAAQAKEVAQKLRQKFRDLKVSDGDMEKGSMRLEANISWGLDLGYKVEVKNLNSFKFLESAISYELERQKKLLDKGEKLKQETRGWLVKEGKTVKQRSKETSADYRYFPEPDIPPIVFKQEYINDIKASLPDLPMDISNNFVKKYNIKQNYADILVSDKVTIDYANKALDIAVKDNVSVNDVASAIVNKKVNTDKTKPKELVATIQKTLKYVVKDTSKLEVWVEEAIKALPKAVEDYKGGNENAIQALVGQVMQLSKDKADASKVKKILKTKLDNKKTS